jgi:hypothetical protein
LQSEMSEKCTFFEKISCFVMHLILNPSLWGQRPGELGLREQNTSAMGFFLATPRPLYYFFAP